MPRKLSKYLAPLAALVTAVGVWLFWWLRHPEYLCYHEQNQLFEWTAAYFAADVSVAGGLADYVGEFIVQFFYVPWLGALLVGLLFAALQVVSWGCIRSYANGLVAKKWLALSLVPPILLTLVMGDLDVLLSFPVAVTVAVGVAWVANRRGLAWWADVCIVAVLFWLIGGGAAWLYVALRLGFALSRGARRWAVLVLIPWLAVVEGVAYRCVLRQYPRPDVMLGINYHRVPCQQPFRTIGFRGDICNILRFNMLVRNEDWDGILTLARQRQAPNDFTCNCVNLALGMKRQLADRMFTFYQTGGGALICPLVRNSLSMYPSMEALWRLGLTTEALRYAFDLQESILRDRMSGRLTKRIAECYIVNGEYSIAQKHLDILKRTLFYSTWALEKERLLGNEDLIARDPDLAQARRFRFHDRQIFSYDEKEKIFGLLFSENHDNRLALDYFMCDLLLKGKRQEFQKYMVWVQQYGGYSSMPRGYQDALRVMQSPTEMPNSPYGAYVIHQTQISRQGGVK